MNVSLIFKNKNFVWFWPVVSMWETFFLRNFLCVFMGMFMNELTLFDKTMGRQYLYLAFLYTFYRFTVGARCLLCLLLFQVFTTVMQ